MLFKSCKRDSKYIFIYLKKYLHFWTIKINRSNVNNIFFNTYFNHGGGVDSTTENNKFLGRTNIFLNDSKKTLFSILQDYQVDLYLRQHWEDPRLNDPAITEALDLNDPRLVQAIWKPEVYFPNAKEGEFQYVTVPNVLLRIEPNGQILYMLRYVFVVKVFPNNENLQEFLQVF